MTYYEEQSGVSLAQQLLAEVERSVALLLEYPYLGAAWLYGKRRLKVRRFPYHVVYMIVDDVIDVMAIAHHRRKPDFWRDRE